MNKNFRWVLLVGGIFSIIAGTYMFFNPISILASLTLIFSIVMLINGIADIVRYIAEKENRRGALLFGGILTTLIAISLMTSTQIGLASFIPYLIAFWVMVSGITRLMLSFEMRKMDKTSGNYLLTIGILGLISSIFLFGHPLFTGIVITYFVGFAFTYQGITNCIEYFKLARK